MELARTLRHLGHPFGRLRLFSRFARLSDLQQLLWLVALVFTVNATIFLGGLGVFLLVQR